MSLCSSSLSETHHVAQAGRRIVILPSDARILGSQADSPSDDFIALG